MFLKPYPSFSCPSGDGHNFVLNEPLDYTAKDGTKYRGMVSAETDGASTPQAIWNLFPPFGKYWLPAVLHDCAYRGMLEVGLGNNSWRRVQLDKDACDALFLEAMESQGVSFIDRETIYNAVKQFGTDAFSYDIAQPIK